MSFLPPLPAKHKGWLAACLAFLLLFAIAAVGGDHGLVHVLRMYGEQRNLEHMTFDLEQRNEQLREQIQRLQSDPDAIEREAREKLHYAKPGEVIYTLPAQPQTQAQPTGK